MAWDDTLTEYEMDPASRQFLNDLQQDSGNQETDLAVDGLSESILSRLANIFRRN